MCHLVNMSETKVAGFRLCCDSHEEFATRIPRTLDELEDQLHEIPNMVRSNARLGIHLADDEESPSKDADNYGYLVCVEVSSFDNIPADFERDTITTGEYAKIIHYGPAGLKLNDSYFTLGNWMKENGYKENPGGRIIEYYDERYDRKSSMGEMEILMPVKYQKGG